MPRRWNTIEELSEGLRRRGHDGKEVRISPGTAILIGAKLVTAEAKPSEAELHAILCDEIRKPCAPVCMRCRGKANIIANRYGMRFPRG